MKPTERGGLQLDSKQEFETTLAAIDHVMDRSEESGGVVGVYGGLQAALTLQFGRKEADTRAGKKDVTYSTEFDETSGEFVLTALRIAADHHSDPATREQAGGMIMDYSMRAAGEEVGVAENQAPQIPPQASHQDQ